MKRLDEIFGNRKAKGPNLSYPKPKKTGFHWGYRRASLARLIGTSQMERRFNKAIGRNIYRRYTEPARRTYFFKRKFIPGLYHPTMTMLRQAHKGYKKDGIKGAFQAAIKRPRLVMAALNPINQAKWHLHRLGTSTGLWGSSPKGQRQKTGQRQKKQPRQYPTFAPGTTVDDIISNRAKATGD